MKKLQLTADQEEIFKKALEEAHDNGVNDRGHLINGSTEYILGRKESAENILLKYFNLFKTT